MKLADIKNCPSTLALGFSTYSPSCLKYVFNNKKVNHILPYDTVQKDEQVAAKFIENRKRISISGVQEKLSFLLDKNVLRLTEFEEQGTYILKPIPRDLKKVAQVPANEHLTMQIAKQVFGIKVAANALVFFKNGTPAYLTKRFDIKSKTQKWGKEDFASLAGKSIDNEGANFKYEFSYEAMGALIRRYVPAWRVEIEKFFRLVLFNYLFSNGDAHLKNFSLLESSRGDYLLSPAYDLLNTRMHVDDSNFALRKGLFEDDFKSNDFKKSGHPSRLDFIEFGNRIGIRPNRLDKLLKPYLEKQPKVELLNQHSFLDNPAKRGYLLMYQTKRNYLNL